MIALSFIVACWLVAIYSAYKSGRQAGYTRGWRDCLETNGVEVE